MWIPGSHQKFHTDRWNAQKMYLEPTRLVLPRTTKFLWTTRLAIITMISSKNTSIALFCWVKYVFWSFSSIERLIQNVRCSLKVQSTSYKEWMNVLITFCHKMGELIHIFFNTICRESTTYLFLLEMKAVLTNLVIQKNSTVLGPSHVDRFMIYSSPCVSSTFLSVVFLDFACSLSLNMNAIWSEKSTHLLEPLLASKISPTIVYPLIIDIFDGEDERLG